MIYSQEQLNSSDFLQKAGKTSEDYMVYNQVNESYNMARDLENSLAKIKNFKELYPEIYSKYLDIINRLKWIGLPVMDEEKIIELFNKQFTQIFFIPYFNFEQFWEKLKIVLLAILDFDERDSFKKKLSQALMDNQEIITSSNLFVNGRESEPIIKNWILNYNSILGTGNIDNLKIIQYFTENKNIKNLTPDDKNRIKFLFNLYEKLKLSSSTLEGLEEEIPVNYKGKKGKIKGGIFEPYETEKKLKKIFTASNQDNGNGFSKNQIIELENLKSKYPPGSLERKAVEEEIEKMNHEL